MSLIDPDTLTLELRALAAETEQRRSATQLLKKLSRGCWIYGAGGYGRLLHGLLTARGIQCYGLLDRRPDAALATELGAPIVHPDALQDGQAAGPALVVGVHNFAMDQTPIVKWARSRGFPEILLPADLPDVLGPDAGSYWLSGRTDAANHIDNLIKLVAMLADRKSVETVAALARFRVSGDIAFHPPGRLEDQYFPADLDRPPAPLSLVDGGAYTGDTYQAAARLGIQIANWYAFEPDMTNFTALAAVAREARVDRAFLFPCGLGARSEQIRFASGENSGSHAVHDGEMVAQVVALDDVLQGVQPNFIKLDIEGFEREALAGMSQTLERFRPHLALSIYHRPEDLWELPALVRTLMPEARLYVRQHGFNGFDTVLYATV